MVRQKGFKHTKETRIKMSLTAIKNGNIPPSRKGVKFTKEQKIKSSNAHKGQIPWSKGKKMIIETKIKISNTLKKYIGNKEEKNPSWKGDKAGYWALHNWIYKKLGKPTYCSNNIKHKAPKYHWANISGEYKREVSDYKQLCPSCNLTDGIKIPKRLKIKKSKIC